MYTFLEHWDRVISVSELNKLDENVLVEMANISPKTTGLPYVVWIDQQGVRRDVSHNYTPRIKVCVNDNWIPIEVSDNPDIPESVKRTSGVRTFPKINKVLAWVKAYKNILTAHFFGKVNDEQTIKLLSTVENASAADIQLNQMLSLERVIKYYWDEEELLYVIELFVGDTLQNTYFAISDNELHLTLSKINSQFCPDKIVKL